MNGYCPALLRTIEQVGGDNSPSRKLQNAGFLSMLNCCQNSSVNPINDGYSSDGHQKPLTVSYRQRPTTADVQTEDDCEINRIPVKSEISLPALAHAQSSFFLSDEEISKFCEDASRPTAIAGSVPPTSIMQEQYELFKETANVLMKSINTQLVTAMATQFGDNVSNGNDVKYININSDGNKLILDNGIIDMQRDFWENEICGDVCLVGGGNFHAWQLAQAIACCNAAGIDASRAIAPTFFPDKDTQTIWGENSVGAFAKGSVALIDRLKYGTRFNGGPKGNSFFFTAPLPVADFGCTDPCQAITFDIQLKYIDCPTDVVVDGSARTINRGWQVIVSKEYALWVQPTNLYAAGDPLAGTNGTLKYIITNTSATTPSY